MGTLGYFERVCACLGDIHIVLKGLKKEQELLACKGVCVLSQK